LASKEVAVERKFCSPTALTSTSTFTETIGAIGAEREARNTRAKILANGGE
jgi:hypothetical protein